MKKVVLLVMLTVFFVAVNVPAWSACLGTGDVVHQGPGKPPPKDPKDPPK
jgi:hypothetical protein